MNKVVCYPRCCMPTTFNDDVWYFELFSCSEYKKENIGHIGATFFKELKKSGIVPTVEAVDFAILALSVVSADKAVLRRKSPDGWTREIHLTTYLYETEKWNAVKDKLEWMLRFLTGDFWSLNILPLPENIIPSYNQKEYEGDCVCLLSGGVDSLVGAIDLWSSNRKPIFVSQVVRGDAKHQREFAKLFGNNKICQWSCFIRKKGESENSTRARSIVFFAFALLATCGMTPGKNGRKEIIVPENGFISLNIPLDPSRIGSLSTKTTHPVYMKSLQEIWNNVGIKVDLTLPYKYKTKGEVLKDCLNQQALRETVFDSTSCGKFQRHGLRHCGTCIPCLVRRAAFLEAGFKDITVKGYCTENLVNAKSMDVAAAEMAILQTKRYGIGAVIKGSLSFANAEEREKYEGVVLRGLLEIEELLKEQGVL